MYVEVNGITMYYEVAGTGMPMVLIHGGGSTITTTFATIRPFLSRYYMTIAVELQAHGHTSDRNAPESFEQDADDVADLMHQLQIDDAIVFGFSNGGNTAMQLAIRHPEKVGQLIIASSFYQRSGLHDWLWEMMANPDFSHMPQIYKDEFLKINNDPIALRTMHDKDASRMINFNDWSDDMLRSIQVPTLLIAGDRDVVQIEHVVKMHQLISKSRLAILPGDHGSYMGEAMSWGTIGKSPELLVEMITEFITSTQHTQ